jgi:hypothetical protein
MQIYIANRATSARWIKTILAGVSLLLATSRSAAFDTDPAIVDESPALTIGDFEVSHYIFDKNYNQFIANRRKKRVLPSRSEIEDWFRLFIAQQAIKAHLQQIGYLNRPEIKGAVARMSRNILTQAKGPLYNTLYDPSPIPVERLRAIHEKSARVFDALIVRFDDDASALRLIGPVGPHDILNRLVSLAGAGQEIGADVHDGPIVWPYHPFEEIADELLSAKPGRLLGPFPRQTGVYYLLIRHETRQAVPDFEAVRPNLERYVRDLDELTVRRNRREKILRECNFSINPEILASWSTPILGSIGNHQTGHVIVTDAAPALAFYLFDGKRRRIGPADFIRHFKQSVVHQTPRDSASLATALEDMVVEEYNYRSAKKAGLDRQPKFVQDRWNFELNQALALYEQEALIPTIALSSGELRTYYNQHREQYLEPSAATGALYIFPTKSRARQAMNRLLRNETAGAMLLAEKVIDPLTITREGPPLFASLPNAFLIQISDGQKIGPLMKSGMFTIFVKTSSSGREAPPLAQIENNVRHDLLRTKLNTAELDLFHRNGSLHTIRFHFDFAKYGIEIPMSARIEGPAPSLPQAILSRSRRIRPE